jgi:hypothetical protein
VFWDTGRCLGSEQIIDFGAGMNPRLRPAAPKVTTTYAGMEVDVLPALLIKKGACAARVDPWTLAPISR